MEAYALVIAAAATYGGYHVGLWGDDKDAGIMGSILAALVFAVPMGFWFAANVIGYALSGTGRRFC
ncbi:hypothetical protein B5V01_30440 [Mesorhizobium erdmanii]|uniref:Uncharacterized protein n=2 Tax=Mesorhizobium TaxID=68287 RepID=A0A3M9WYW8_9HYPH|nr:hypothetical protein DNR46_36085 [Mesorhizobium japonicum]RXT36119.1 hypothetical protein B5V01_30440 [Mesorhizobium erdmanii]